MATARGSTWWAQAVLTIAVVAAIGAGNAPVLAQEPCPPYAIEEWDGGDPNGWEGSAGSVLTVPLSGGHPGGYLQADNDLLVGAQTSDPPWIGDWAVPGIARITVDLIFPTADLNAPFLRLRRDGVTNGWYFSLGSIGSNDGQWHHYEAPVSPWWTDQEAEAAGWSEGAGTHVSFADTLASVAIIQVSASSPGGSHLMGIDNFTLTPCLFSDGFETGDTSRWDVSLPRPVPAGDP
jgi:hypothetical protein